MRDMGYAICITFLLGAALPAVACEPALPLSGTETVPTCLEEGPECRSAARVLYEYTEAQPDDPTVFSIALQSSPWRFYGPDMRILTVEELADVVRPQLEPGHARVELYGSWTGLADGPSLASRLSRALDGFPVTGMDGFLWMDRNGAMRTTKQAFTLRSGTGPYRVPKDGEVFVSLVVGWIVGHEHRFGPEEGELMLLAGVGNDAFLLCPDGALANFEAAAKMGNAVAAYNAALVRLERGRRGDRDAALKLLEHAAALGDAKAAQRLQSWSVKGEKEAESEASGGRRLSYDPIAPTLSSREQP